MEQVKDREPVQPPADWSEEDKAWFHKTCPEKIKLVAVKWGRPLIELTMVAGGCSYALGLLARRNAGNREQMEAIRKLQAWLDILMKKSLLGAGLTVAQFQECNNEVNLHVALQDKGEPELPAGSRVSKGGIILDS